MTYWESDQAAYFKNEVVASLANDYKMQHNFTAAYFAWVNGNVESCMRHILAVCRALLSEWKLGPQDWPIDLGCVMSVLNEDPL